MKELNTVAAILTVAFYSGRGSAMSLPQIVATYDELRALLAEREAPRSRTRKKKKL